MRKLTSWIAPLVLLLAAAVIAPAWAGEAPVAPAALAAPAAASALCPAAPAAQTQRGTPPLAGLAPEPLFAAICTVQCVNTSCRRDSDCTAAPNGSCVFACPKVGCCAYP